MMMVKGRIFQVPNMIKARSDHFESVTQPIFSTPNFEIGQAKLQIVQDVSYTVYNNPDNSALSFIDSLAAGFVFYTGVRVTMGMKSFL